MPNSPYAKIDRFYKNLSIFFSTYDKLDGAVKIYAQIYLQAPAE